MSHGFLNRELDRVAGQLRQHRVERHDLSVRVRLDARLRLVRWLLGFALIKMLPGRPVRVDNSVLAGSLEVGFSQPVVSTAGAPGRATP